MVVRPEITSAPKLLVLNFCRFFCCVLAIVFFSMPAVAEPDFTTASGDLCILPALGNAISQYRQIAAQGGWPQVPAGPTLHEGDRNERIPLLKKRLIVSEDLAASADQNDLFDEPLKMATQRFQTRHGLAADGAVGAKVLSELNVPINERIQQLTASLERCQPLPSVMERRYILVNIADFTLKLFEDGNLRLSMPVIVGRTYRQTPVFNGRIATLVVNPTWEVPHSIATKDLLPKIKKNPGYLGQMHLKVFQGWKGTTAVDPASINWASISPAHFPYRLRQEPGPDNALGRVKFLFPNPYDVYLHDTPARELFHKDSRTFSSGCIRIGKPLDLAVYLMQGTPLGSMDGVNAAISREKTQSIAIPSPIAVHIVYMTAWVDNEGIIQFRPDIYNRNPTQ